MFDCEPTGHDWVNKGLGMSSRVCATGHIKDPVPIIETSRASCPGGRFPASFIHQVINGPECHTRADPRADHDPPCEGGGALGG